MNNFKRNLIIVIACVFVAMLITWKRNINFDSSNYQLKQAYIENVECGFKTGCYFYVAFRLNSGNKRMKIWLSGINLQSYEDLKGDSCLVGYNIVEEEKSEIILTKQDLEKFKK